MSNEVSQIAEDIEIPASDDADGLRSPVHLTYRQHYNQVQNQHVNQVNHFHVHVPASPSEGGDQPQQQQQLDFAPDPSSFAGQPFTFARQAPGYKLNPNKRLLCDSKVVPIRSAERSSKKGPGRSVASPSSPNTNGGRRPGPKIFVDGSGATGP